MHEPMSPRREAIVRREMADTTYGGTWHIRENETGECAVWEVTRHGKVLATLPDWGGNLAMWIADARDDVPQLLALVTQLRADLTEARVQLEIAERRNAELAEQLEKYVGHEPTVVDEMAYLNRCLNAVHDLCREADGDGNTSDGKFTPAAVLQAASGEREDAPDDRRRRLYLDGEGSVWVDGSVTQDGEQWIGCVHPSGGQFTLAEVRERTGELHEIGRTW